MQRLRNHLPEYLAEAAGLGFFMISAAGFACLIEHPASPVRQAIGDPVVRRMLMGIAMGLTLIAIVYSPIGARSGAHLNPAMTLTFFRLGRVNGADASAYAVFQVLGGLAGIGIAAVLLAPWVGSPNVRYVATLPGPWGLAAAFGGELLITFAQMTAVLHVSNHPRWSRLTGVCAAALVAVYITVENPLSGMSMNAARSLGPAILAGELGSFWIYLAAPVLGMLAAAELYVRTRGAHRVFCAKLNHHTTARCIFHCRFDRLAAAPAADPAPSTASLVRGH